MAMMICARLSDCDKEYGVRYDEDGDVIMEDAFDSGVTDRLDLNKEAPRILD